jgi:hypothetical protein
MRFYYNAGLNICAEEQWVAEYLVQYNDWCALLNTDEVIEILREKREYFGWYECEVSNTIAESMEGLSLDNY